MVSERFCSCIYLKNVSNCYKSKTCAIFSCLYSGNGQACYHGNLSLHGKPNIQFWKTYNFGRTFQPLLNCLRKDKKQCTRNIEYCHIVEENIFLDLCITYFSDSKFMFISISLHDLTITFAASVLRAILSSLRFVISCTQP